ncbi:MAG: AAA domain-containing protein, partial [Gemmatimonadota bacterium]
MDPPEGQSGDIKQRLVDLVGYVEHMVRLGEKPVFALGEYRQLTYHEAELKGRIGIRHDQADDDGPIWLSIDRLKRIDPPDVPEKIHPWITISPDPFTEPVVAAVRTETIVKADADEFIEEGILEEEDVQPALRPGRYGEEEEQAGLCDVIFRLENLTDIEASVRTYVQGPWREWAEEEKPRRETIKVYDDFFSLQHSVQAMDGEQGLEVVWGMGMARWRLEDGRTIDHPLVEQLVEIDMDTSTGQINIRPRWSTEPQVALKAFSALDNPGADQVDAFAKKFFASFPEDQDISPFNGETFEPILREAASRLHGEARYHPDDLSDITDRTVPPIGSTLRVTNTWVVFARQRSENFFISDLGRLKTSIEEADELPGPAKRLVTEPSSQTTYTPTLIDLGHTGFGSGGGDAGGVAPAPAPEPGIEATRTDEFFFPKPFNDDQISIIRRLNEADGVVVQGPPGTGKTHTIANIICHYLATGRRVLVTSKGEAALTVLRDHVPEGIRDFTISLLTNERAGLKQLEQAVTVLANTATQVNPRQLEREIKTGQERINGLRKKIKDIDRELGEWADRHLKPIGEGDKILPMELAQKIVGNRERHAWLPDQPGPEAKYDPLFTDEDIANAREARKALGDNLQYLGRDLPSLSDLPDAAIITAVHEDLVSAKKLEDSAADRNTPVLSLSAERAVERAGKLLEAVKRVAAVFQDLEG